MASIKTLCPEADGRRGGVGEGGRVQKDMRRKERKSIG